MAIFGVVPHGVLGTLFEVEVALGERGSGIRISGNIDKVANEGTTRISKALDSSGFPIEHTMYDINLHPASMLKCGTSCDLSIALAILTHSKLLCASDEDDTSPTMVKISKRNTSKAIEDVDALISHSQSQRKETEKLLRWLNNENILVIGELRFDASITSPQGTFGMLAAAIGKKKFRMILVPTSANEQCKLLLSRSKYANAQIFCVDNLQSAYRAMIEDNPRYQVISFTREELISKSKPTLDCKDIRGQALAKRAIEVAAAGGHNVLLIGPPGEGKTMLLKACSGILPPPTLSEIFDINSVFSSRGLLEDGEIIVNRPFREVPATATKSSIFGGVFSGRLLSPGEISLSHHGALIMDELPQRPRELLEELRTPMQDKSYVLSKFGLAVRFPSNFIFLSAMNPCPCGYHGEFVCERCGETLLNLKAGCSEHGLRFKKHKCKCLPSAIPRYLAKLSGPLRDRIDIVARVSTLTARERLRKKREEPSNSIRKRVHNARKLQRARYDKLSLDNIRCNADLSERVIEYVQLTQSAKKFVEDPEGIILKRVTTRKFYQILKVARTVADLDTSPGVHKRHILEAITMMGIYDNPEEYYVVDEKNIHTRIRQEMLRRGIVEKQVTKESQVSIAQLRLALNGDELSSDMVEQLSQWYWKSVEK